MGLDMFIFSSDKKSVTFDDMDTELKEEIYWRKVNAVHNWFVENVQNNIDDCEIYPVSKDKFKELLNICEEILNDYTKAEKLLPTRSGFFFGSTLYNDMYFDDLLYTRNKLEELLNKKDNKYYYYWSSW